MGAVCVCARVRVSSNICYDISLTCTFSYSCKRRNYATANLVAKKQRIKNKEPQKKYYKFLKRVKLYSRGHSGFPCSQYVIKSTCQYVHSINTVNKAGKIQQRCLTLLYTGTSPDNLPFRPRTVDVLCKRS